MEIEAYALYSGSSGNSVYVRAGNDAILIDCGKTLAALNRALSDVGGSMDNVRAVFITHEHLDHVSAAEVIARKLELPIHITKDSLAEMRGCRVFNVAVPHPPVFSVTIGAMTVTSFVTHHDCAMSVGYTVDFDGSKTRLGIVTDTGHFTSEMTAALSTCTHVMLEANYDKRMLADGSYPFYLKERIASPFGHLSNNEAALLATELTWGKTRSFMLAHLSRDNNTPVLACGAVGRAIGMIRRSFYLTVAYQDVPMRLI